MIVNTIGHASASSLHVPPKVRHFAKKAWALTKKVTVLALQVLASCFLYWVNSSLFVLGFTAGVISHKSVLKAVETIRFVGKQQTAKVTALTVVALILAPAIPLATASALVGAYVGAALTKETIDTARKEKIHLPPYLRES